jgi:uncharacterized RDD family membrane protein YckC
MIACSKAEFWKRVGALVIDGGIVYLVCVVILGVGSAAGGIKLSPPGTVTPGEIIVSQILFFLMGWLYFALGESSPLKATIGKLALGIMVTDLEGKRLSFFKATKRFWAKVIASLVIAASIMKKEPFHDIMVGTLVVNKVALAKSPTAKGERAVLA